MRTQQTLGTVVALVLVALTAGLLVAAPAAGAGTTPTSIAIEHKMKKGIYADSIGPAMDGSPDEAGYRATLTSNGMPVAGQVVVLERKLYDEDTWTAVDQPMTPTDSNGQVVVLTPVRGNAKYRFTYAGDLTYAAAVSATKTLKAMRDLNTDVVEKGGKAFLKGNVNPGWGGKKVFFQKKKGTTWVTIATQRASKSGAFRFQGAYPPKRGVTWKFRARIPKSKGFIESFGYIYLQTWVVRSTARESAPSR